MAAIKLNCLECGKEFQTYTDSWMRYCSVGCQMKKYEEHPPDCPWHRDWHACNCGAFDVEDESGKQIEEQVKIIQLEDGKFFLPIPDNLVKKLSLKEGGVVYLHETEIWDEFGDRSGFTVSRVKNEEK